MMTKTVILCHQGGAASDISDRDCTVVTLAQTCHQVENNILDVNITGTS